MIVSGWVHRHQLLVIEFLQAETACSKRGCEESESGSPTLSVLFWDARPRR
jgi:hypothetical protein